MTELMSRYITSYGRASPIHDYLVGCCGLMTIVFLYHRASWFWVHGDAIVHSKSLITAFLL